MNDDATNRSEAVNDDATNRNDDMKHDATNRNDDMKHDATNDDETYAGPPCEDGGVLESPITTDDDELMKRVSTPPEFPPARSEQVEKTWSAIVGEIEAREAERIAAARPLRRASRGTLQAWFEAMIPAAPDGSWRLAKVAALIVVGFGAAWVAASQGWLPGTASTEVVSVPDVGDDEAPDRTWLAVGDYGSRLEALLLGVSTGDTPVSGDVVPAAREVSRELLSDNRFYQRVAKRRNDPALSELLSRMEIILLALATAPEGQEQEVIDALREFIDESHVLGDLRALRASVPQRPRPSAAITGS